MSSPLSSSITVINNAATSLLFYYVSCLTLQDAIKPTVSRLIERQDWPADTCATEHKTPFSS